MEGVDGTLQQPEPSCEHKEIPSAAGKRVMKSKPAGESDVENAEIGPEDIVKELNKVKRQNSLTHWLLSIMIVLTVAWQVSEVSLILKVKNGLSHPFRSFASMFSGMLGGRSLNGQDDRKQLSFTMQQPMEAPSLPPIEIPELPRLDLTTLGLNGERN